MTITFGLFRTINNILYKQYNKKSINKIYNNTAVHINTYNMYTHIYIIYHIYTYIPCIHMYTKYIHISHVYTYISYVINIYHVYRARCPRTVALAPQAIKMRPPGRFQPISQIGHWASIEMILYTYT